MIQYVGSCKQMQTFRSTSNEALTLVKKQGLVRIRDFEAHGIPRAKVAGWVTEGSLVRVARGLYGLPGHELGEHESLVQLAKLVPNGAVCLLSALRFHGMTTQNPSEVWLGIDRKSRKPRLEWPPLRIVWWSGEATSAGIVEVKVARIPIRITSPARTVADCFKYRNKIGLDVAIEALRDFRRKKKGTLDELHRAATACRVDRVMRPYLEALT
jgi:predicted transcriptional regulator of viral defense system